MVGEPGTRLGGREVVWESGAGAGMVRQCRRGVAPVGAYLEVHQEDLLPAWIWGGMVWVGGTECPGVWPEP